MNTVIIEPGTLLPAANQIIEPWSLLATLLYIVFTIHLLLMNTVVGMAAISFMSNLGESKSYRLPTFPHPQHASSAHALMPKLLALTVNLGVAPFLFIQILYGQFIYSSSILMACWWLSIMFFVMLAYYGLYFYGAQGNLSFSTQNRALGIATLFLLITICIFTSNNVLMLSPAEWVVYAKNQAGTLFFVNPHVLARALHTILSCFAVGGIVMALIASARINQLEKIAASPNDLMYQTNVKRKGQQFFVVSTTLQFLAGAYYFMVLPKPQQLLFMGTDMTATILFGIGLSCALISLICALLQRIWLTAFFTVVTVFLMSGMRTILRTSMLKSHYAPQIAVHKDGSLWILIGAALIAGAGIAAMCYCYWRKEKSIPEANGEQLSSLQEQE